MTPSMWFLLGFLVCFVLHLVLMAMYRRGLHRVGRARGVEFLCGEPFSIVPEAEYVNGRSRWAFYLATWECFEDGWQGPGWYFRGDLEHGTHEQVFGPHDSRWDAEVNARNYYDGGGKDMPI